MSARPSLGPAWTGLFSGPALWFAQQQLSYWLRPLACAGRPWLLWLVSAATLAALALCALAAGQLLRSPLLAADRVTPATRFLASLGVASPLMFLLAFAFQAAAVLSYSPCMR